MALVKHKLLLAKSCCTFQGFKKINLLFINKCANMSCDLVCCQEKKEGKAVHSTPFQNPGGGP